ncbi:MAG TPA: right-handed parallel beta-helix repeat-containing protein [Acidobacteriaceae bacterium]|nr:right-handed parallel beta-helix repeat-containing protein [Acidobacteriaceae bacterium]
MLSKRTLLLLATLLVAGSTGRAQNSSPSGSGRHFYLDCSAAQGGAGDSQESAWNSVARLNAEALRPGDIVALRRGTICHGSLAPSGSGSEGAPIRLTAYGEGSRPRIVADSNAAEALLLFNQQEWDIDSLDLSGGRTNGILISGDNGMLRHIHLANLAVHDVMGGAMKHKESGLVAVSPANQNCHFDDVLIDNVVGWNTNQWVGIMVGGGDLGYPPESDWSSNVTIRNSVIHDVQGDGIVLFRVRHGVIESSVAWNTGMQGTESIGTPNAIWTWMCDDCVVRNNEAFLTDSPGVDGGAYDIDYGNTKNSVIDNYGHDTQGYCVAVFGAGFVTRESLVRGNLCINNGRSPRMADYQGAIFIYTWNGGSINGLTIDHNTVVWSPFNNAPALLNNADIAAGSATFRDNHIDSTAPWMVGSNTSLSLSQNHYRYYGLGGPQFRYGSQTFDNLRKLQLAVHQEAGSIEMPLAMRLWPPAQPKASGIRKLNCTVPISLDDHSLLAGESLSELVTVRSQAQQYFASRLEVSLNFTSPDATLLESPAFRNAVADLDLDKITVTHAAVRSGPQCTLLAPSGAAVAQWNAMIGPVALGRSLRDSLGEPYYAQMNAIHDDQ